MSVSPNAKPDVRAVDFWLQEAGATGAVLITAGMGYGMALALRHPEYAQAYVRLMGVPAGDAAVDEFIEAVPIQVRGDTDASVN